MESKSGYPHSATAPYPPEQNVYPPPGGHPSQMPHAGAPAPGMYPPVPYPDQHFPPTNPPPYEPSQPMINPNAKPGFYPQQPGMAPHPQQVVQVVTVPQVGPNPIQTICPSCREQVRTRMEYETSGKTHLFAGLLCLFICWPCFWVPYCIDSCKNANHYCPNCSAYLGTYRN